MQVFGQEFGGHDHGRWEERAEEESLQGDCNGGNVELGDEPEDEAEGDGADDVDLIVVRAINQSRVKGDKLRWRSSPPLAE